MRAFRGIVILAVLSLGFPGAARCGTPTAPAPAPTQALVTWNANTDVTVTGYQLVWGPGSSNYTSSTNLPATATSTIISGLGTNEYYYFNIAASNSYGMSPYAGEAILTNLIVESTNAQPPFPVPTTNTPTTNNPPTNNPTTLTNFAQSLFWGVPPFMTLSISNGQPNLNIGGTVGATVTVESTSNLMSMERWSEVTNVSVTNIAPIALSNQQAQPQDALDVAFVPGLQTVALPATNGAGSQFFRVVMPYDYVILASMVLPGKGYTPRLIAVNMPGIVWDDACYVGQSSSFIHFDRGTYALQLEGSGSTIRQIATQLASSLNLSWTSASEFTYSNGISQILATVVETEPPSSDPVAQKTTSNQSNAIDF